MSNYKPQKFSKMIGVSVRTLQRWDKEGILKAYRTPTDRRYYTDEQYEYYMQTTSTPANNFKSDNLIKITLTTEIDNVCNEKLNNYCKANNRNVSDVIQEALNMFIDNK